MARDALVLAIVVSVIVCSGLVHGDESVHEFKIGCFNIKDFSERKSKCDVVMDILARIVRRYDIVLIEELSNPPKDPGVCGNLTGTVICKLAELAEVPRDVVVSPRLPPTSTQAEQYAVLYDPTQFEILSSWIVNDSSTHEPSYDKYLRPPMVTMIKSRLSDHVFSAGVIHTKPGVESEIMNLPNELVKLREESSEYSFICGDFNTDKSFSKKDWEKFYEALPEGYGMEIADDEMTSLNSGLAIDRIITTPALHAIASDGHSFWFNDTSKGGWSMQPIIGSGCSLCKDDSCTLEYATKTVSDHYPVEMTIRFPYESCSSSVTVSFILFFAILVVSFL